MRPSLTASKVPGGAEGCLGSIWNLTRPLVAFSTCSPHTTTTFLVRGWDGDTQLDMVIVVWAVAGVGRPASEAAASVANAAERGGETKHCWDPPGSARRSHPAIRLRGASRHIRTLPGWG